MKKLIFTLLCLLMTIGMAAQRPNQEQGKRKEFSPEAYRQRMESFIAKEACLSNEEQEKFFPMLREMMEAQRKLMEQEREIMMSGKEAKTEADFEKIIKKTTELQVENRKIEVTYYKKFYKVLTWEKIYKVRVAITKFNMHALRNFAPRNNKQWQHHNRQPQKK